MANPFMKTCGGKRQLLPALLSRVPESFETYHEPFVGGGALFFALQAQGRIKRAILSDANERLIRTYRAVRDNVEHVIREVLAMPITREHFLKVRAECPDDGTDTDVAVWFLYMNRAGFNGLYRENRKGRCNVSYGTPKAPVIDADAIRASSAALQGVEIRHSRFEDSTALVASGDFVYFDPPYWPASETASFVSYTAQGFTAKDQEKLRDAVLELKQRGAHILLSNSDVPKVRKLYAGFEFAEVSARRSVNCKEERRGRIGELLIR